MKSANEHCPNCTEFQEHISDLIDDEMSGPERDGFMQHAEACPDCREKLLGCRHVKNLLGKLSPVGVSADFDVRLKSRVRMESNFLEDPVYRLKLFMSDNLPRLAAVPAAAAIIITAFLYGYNRYNTGTMNPSELVTSPRISYPIEQLEAQAEGQTQEEIVSYILESINENDIETGVFLNEMNNQAEESGTVDPNNEMTPVSDFTF